MQHVHKYKNNSFDFLPLIHRQWWRPLLWVLLPLPHFLLRSIARLLPSSLQELSHRAMFLEARSDCDLRALFLLWSLLSTLRSFLPVAMLAPRWLLTPSRLATTVGHHMRFEIQLWILSLQMSSEHWTRTYTNRTARTKQNHSNFRYSSNRRSNNSSSILRHGGATC